MPDRVEILTSASREEAAAVMAAIQQFRRDHAPIPVADAATQSPWLRAALLEGTGREADAPSPWGDPVPWGR